MTHTVVLPRKHFVRTHTMSADIKGSARGNASNSWIKDRLKKRRVCHYTYQRKRNELKSLIIWGEGITLHIKIIRLIFCGYTPYTEKITVRKDKVL